MSADLAAPPEHERSESVAADVAVTRCADMVRPSTRRPLRDYTRRTHFIGLGCIALSVTDQTRRRAFGLPVQPLPPWPTRPVVVPPCPAQPQQPNA